MRAPIRVGLQIPSFNFPDVAPDRLFERLAEIAETAEASGFDSIFVMDHLHQIPGVGPQTNWMLEGNTILAALAARTQRLHLGLMVGGVTYRNPALHAKITTTLDVISGGRAIHSIGAAWFEDEHRAYGFEFPPLKERFERLEEHLQIARAMFTQESATLRGSPLPRRGRPQQPAATARRHPDPGGRQRRAEDASSGRPVRRRKQHLRRSRPPSGTCSGCSTTIARASAAILPRSRKTRLGTLAIARSSRAGRRRAR